MTTTLTPLGAERAGNADGSIPAWTGGYVTAPTGPNTPIDTVVFGDEKPLYTIDASNMSQYSSLLTPGTQALIQKNNLTLNVYQSIALPHGRNISSIIQPRTSPAPN